MTSYVQDLLERALAAAPALLAHRIVAEFEPMPPALSYRASHARMARQMIEATPHDGFARFATPIGRNAFLVAAAEHLTPVVDHEELIVAFGRRLGPHDHSPSRLEGLWRGFGDRDRVGMTPLLRDAITKQTGSIERAEVIYLHNHPEHDIKSLIRLLFGWKPLPSSGDRDTALNINVRAALASVLGPTNHHRFYLVDEGRLARFWLPSVEKVALALKALGLVPDAMAGYRR